MRTYVTICSKEKCKDIELLPAIDRYVSSRIKKVFELSKKEKANFRILSGEYGLLRHYDLIPYYDKLLMMEDVDSLIPIVKKQLKTGCLTDILFFTKDADIHHSWKSYNELLELACDAERVNLEKRLS